MTCRGFDPIIRTAAVKPGPKRRGMMDWVLAHSVDGTARATKGWTSPRRESPLKAADTSYTERAAHRVGHAHLIRRREKARYQESRQRLSSRTDASLRPFECLKSNTVR
jgi:hypothetical protein